MSCPLLHSVASYVGLWQHWIVCMSLTSLCCLILPSFYIGSLPCLFFPSGNTFHPLNRRHYFLSFSWCWISLVPLYIAYLLLLQCNINCLSVCVFCPSPSHCELEDKDYHLHYCYSSLFFFFNCLYLCFFIVWNSEWCILGIQCFLRK